MHIPLTVAGENVLLLFVFFIVLLVRSSVLGVVDNGFIVSAVYVSVSVAISVVTVSVVITLRTSCGVVYCNRSCLCVCVFVGLLPR